MIWHIKYNKYLSPFLSPNTGANLFLGITGHIYQGINKQESHSFSGDMLPTQAYELSRSYSLSFLFSFTILQSHTYLCSTAPAKSCLPSLSLFSKNSIDLSDRPRFTPVHPLSHTFYTFIHIIDHLYFFTPAPNTQEHIFYTEAPVPTTGKNSESFSTRKHILLRFRKDKRIQEIKYPPNKLDINTFSYNHY